MKRNSLIIIIPIIIAVLLIAIASFAKANVSETNNNGEYEDTYSPTGERTFVRLKRTANDKIDVYLELADTTVADETDKVIPGASVASFQIGLDIQMDLEDKNSAITFEFNPELQEEAYSKLMKTTWADKEKEEGHTVVEQLNIYYVGTKELNDAGKLEGIKVGTITFKGIEHEETATIIPNEQFTKISSVGHNETEINIKPEDSLSQIIIEPTTSENIPTPTPTGEASNPTPTVKPTENEVQNPEENPTEAPQGTPTNESKPTQKPSSNNSGIPTTGDIAIELFVILMVVSLIGIIAVLRMKKVKSVKNSGNHRK